MFPFVSSFFLEVVQCHRMDENKRLSPFIGLSTTPWMVRLPPMAFATLETVTAKWLPPVVGGVVQPTFTVTHRKV